MALNTESLERGIERAISNALSRIVRGDHQEQSSQGETRSHGDINEVESDGLSIRHSTSVRDNQGRNQPNKR